MNEDTLIYGVDPNRPVTPTQVRDAMVRCFYLAHKSELDQMFRDTSYMDESQLDEFKYQHIELLIRKFFQEVNGDYDHPTKQSLYDVVSYCKHFASSFRDKQVIENNAQLIGRLIDNIDDPCTDG